MAQVTGGSNFDRVWEEWANVSLALLREAANKYSTFGEASLEPRTVVASLLAVVARPRPASLFIWPKWPTRFFDGAQQPPDVADSLAQLAAPSARPPVSEIESALIRVIASAAAEWSQGDPEQPETRAVLRDVFDILWKSRLVPRPPSKKYPRGV